MEIRSLPQGPGRNERRPWTDDSKDVGAGPGFSVQLLPLRSEPQAGRGSRPGIARCDSAYRSGVAVLRTAAHDAGVTPPRMDDKSEAGLSADARGQLAVRATAQVRDHDRFQPRPPDLSQLGARVGADRCKPAVDRRYNLHPAAGRVRVS